MIFSIRIPAKGFQEQAKPLSRTALLFSLLADSAVSFTDHCVVGIIANRDNIAKVVDYLVGKSSHDFCRLCANLWCSSLHSTRTLDTTRLLSLLRYANFVNLLILSIISTFSLDVLTVQCELFCTTTNIPDFHKDFSHQLRYFRLRTRTERLWRKRRSNWASWMPSSSTSGSALRTCSDPNNHSLSF